MNNIKLLILDVDGVLTDGGLYLSDTGVELKKFNVKDGLGLVKLKQSGVKVGIISNGHNAALVNQRAKMLGIEHVYVGSDLKLTILKAWCVELNILLSEVAYIGDDINDIPCMQVVGLSACPADAASQVLNLARLKLSKNGGQGCVREFIEINYPHIFS